MLVLSRRRGETIVIGESITIQVVEIRGDKCRIGITAPPDVRIDRQEVHLGRIVDADMPNHGAIGTH